jgi:hypothetical protein
MLISYTPLMWHNLIVEREKKCDRDYQLLFVIIEIEWCTIDRVKLYKGLSSLGETKGKNRNENSRQLLVL